MTSTLPGPGDGRRPEPVGSTAPADLMTEQQVARVAALALHAWNLAERRLQEGTQGGPAAAGCQERLDRLLTAVARAQCVLRDVAGAGPGTADG